MTTVKEACHRSQLRAEDEMKQCEADLLRLSHLVDVLRKDGNNPPGHHHKANIAMLEEIVGTGVAILNRLR